MKNFKFTTKAGVEVELSVEDMVKVQEHYERECVYEYLEENYPWDEETLRRVTETVRYLMVYKDYTEEDAIHRCIKDWNLPTQFSN